jgi:hypothetical protein
VETGRKSGVLSLVRRRGLLPKGNVYLRTRDERGVWCHDDDFANLFSRREVSRRKRRGGWRW